MARTVLVPLDGSELAEQALVQVRPLVDRLGLEVALLTCVPPAEDESGAAPSADAAREYLAEVTRRALGPSVRSTARVATGDPASEILDEIARRPPYLVALTTHGRSGIARWIRGSVAQRLLRRSPAPLLVCRPFEDASEGDHGPFRRILVPLDGSERANRILPLVQDVARSYGSRVVLLRVARRLDAAQHDPPITPDGLARSLHDARARLESAQVEVEARGRFGDAAAEVVACADEHAVDLIAMSTHGRTGLRRWLFGSVAEHVFDECRAPLLVQRSTDLAGGEAG